MQVVLVMFRSDGERRSFSVVRNMTVIGRREDCDLRIPVGDVSRKHCRLVRTDDGIRIEDLGSSNGTYVNGQRIQESELAPGDTVGVGPVQFVVQIDGVPDEDQMTSPSTAPPRPDDTDVQTAVHDEIPAENEFQIEDEPVAAEETPVADLEEAPIEETPLEAPLEEVPAAQAPAAALELEEFPLDEEPLAEPPAVAAAPAAPSDFDELELEEIPLEEAPLEEIPLEEEPVAQSPTPVPVSAAPPAPDALDDFDDFELEEEQSEPTPAATAALPATESGHDELELELEEAPPALAAVTPVAAPEQPADSLNELEFDESAFELEETAPAAHQAPTKPAETEPLELAPTPPAYAEVDIDSTEETLDELELVEEPETNGQAPAPAAGESSWDFVIEETDASRSHHDFKLDLDSPHEQPHGQA